MYVSSSIRTNTKLQLHTPGVVEEQLQSSPAVAKASRVTPECLSIESTDALVAARGFDDGQELAETMKSTITAFIVCLPDLSIVEHVN